MTITSSSEGFGFKVIGGNAVGLFVSEVKPVRKELCQGDQILEINGQDARHMTHCEASQLLRSCRDKVHLKVMDNGASESTTSHTHTRHTHTHTHTHTETHTCTHSN